MGLLSTILVCTKNNSLYDFKDFESDYATLYLDDPKLLQEKVVDNKAPIIFFDLDDFLDVYDQGVSVLEEIKKENPSAVIIVSCSAENLEKTGVLVANGARFLLKKPFVQSEINFILSSVLDMRRKITKEQRLVNNIQNLSSKIESWGYIDVLTQCYNHRYFSRRLAEEFNRSIRTVECLSEVIFDIDSFSSINEVYGLEIGDIVISQFADVLKDSLRAHDVLCRTGGQEFSVLLVSTESEGAEIFANRIIEVVEGTVFGTDKEYLKITISAGVSTCPTDKVRTSADLIRTAKLALKEAKQAEHSVSVVYDKGAEIQHSVVDPEVLRHKITDLNYQLNQGLIDMIYGFARIIEAKDEYTGHHVESTQSLALELAKELDLPEEQVENIRHAAILHDLGKVGIDDRILRKEGSLTPEEFEEIKQHPVIAAEILKSIHSLRSAMPAILHHHERYDGTGYPEELAGDNIPLEARIISIADVYQALTSDRPYREAFSKEKALEIIKGESGKQFDPEIVTAFLRIVEK